MTNSTVRVAIAGLGNCANSLIQGIAYYRDADTATAVPGLMHVDLGGYHVGDIEIVAAFDVDAAKVGSDVAKAMWAGSNDTIRFADVAELGVEVQRGPTLDGLGRYYRDEIQESATTPVDVVAALRTAKADVLVSYLPVGSEEATRFYAEAALEAGVGFINCIPVFIASDPAWAQRFVDAGVPIIGDDIKSQVGATIVHRTLARLFEDRGLAIDRTYQLNVGGNMDFKNMLERERLESKKISKTQSVTSRSIAASRATTFTSDRRITFPGSPIASGRSSAWKVAALATSPSRPSSSSRSGTRRTRPASSSTPCAASSSPRTGAWAGRCSLPPATS